MDYNKRMGNKEKFYGKLKEEKAVGKKRKFMLSVLASVMVFTLLSGTVFGQNGDGTAVNNTVVTVPVSESLQGKLFDAAGNKLTVYNPAGPVYNAKGEEIFIFQDKTGALTVGNREEYDARMKEIYKFVNDLALVKQYFIGDLRFPSHLPEGMSFGYAMFQDTYDKLYTEGNSYAVIDYLNGSSNFGWTVENIGELDGATYFTMRGYTNESPLIKINGHDAIITGTTLRIEIDNILYTFRTDDKINMDELTKIAGSM